MVRDVQTYKDLCERIAKYAVMGVHSWLIAELRWAVKKKKKNDNSAKHTIWENDLTAAANFW